LAYSVFVAIPPYHEATSVMRRENTQKGMERCGVLTVLAVTRRKKF